MADSQAYAGNDFAWMSVSQMRLARNVLARIVFLDYVLMLSYPLPYIPTFYFLFTSSYSNKNT